ncbi:MAG: hypothetical protein J7500_09695 [Sphingomonas sp.]|uniref:hypothetical protein n=1 Tax=Sphingomonas sp. TaxID=28214 RepID=UPI001B04AED5|nr:hypothetical protein [Sphingomonas sp.]MBO9622971.1 hypothetical protein [Sphingomonas sp.]
MSEIAEDEAVEAGADSTTLLYDYFKHLTSLCVLSLGGVLALVPNARDLKPGLIMGVLAVIGFAALLSFGGTSEIVRAGFLRSRMHKSVNSCRVAAPVLLSLGIGMFVYLFARTLQS